VNLIIGDTLAQIIGLASILIGIMSLVLATYGYFKKGKDINEQSFIHPKLIVILLTISLLLIFLTFTIYYFFAWELFN
jgi:putative membrane protein